MFKRNPILFLLEDLWKKGRRKKACNMIKWPTIACFVDKRNFQFTIPQRLRGCVQIFDNGFKTLYINYCSVSALMVWISFPPLWTVIQIRRSKYENYILILRTKKRNFHVHMLVVAALAIVVGFLFFLWVKQFIICYIEMTLQIEESSVYTIIFVRIALWISFRIHC